MLMKNMSIYILLVIISMNHVYAGMTGVATTLGFMELSKDSTRYTENKNFSHTMKSAKDDALLYIASDGKQGNTARLAEAAKELRATRGQQLTYKQVAEYIVKNY